MNKDRPKEIAIAFAHYMKTELRGEMDTGTWGEIYDEWISSQVLTETMCYHCRGKGTANNVKRTLPCQICGGTGISQIDIKCVKEPPKI